MAELVDARDLKSIAPIDSAYGFWKTSLPNTMENDGTKRDLENGFTPVFGAARVREFISFCGAAAYRSAAKAAGGRPPSNVRPGARSCGPAGQASCRFLLYMCGEEVANPRLVPNQPGEPLLISLIETAQ